MMNYREELVGKLRQAAVKAGARGIHYLGEGAAVAIDALEQLQEKLAQYDTEGTEDAAPAEHERQAAPPSTLDKQALAAAELLLDEARAVEERIRGAKSARKPLHVTVEATPESEPVKAPLRGRKTTATATAPKRATARASTEGFKAKRGQKHSHNH